jgi:hypothetical protein
MSVSILSHISRFGKAQKPRFLVLYSVLDSTTPLKSVEKYVPRLFSLP